MLHQDETPITNLDPKKAQTTTESGELERRALRRRKIDCVGNPEITDRRVENRGGRRIYDLPHAS
jgi:hypothetical protein